METQERVSEFADVVLTEREAVALMVTVKNMLGRSWRRELQSMWEMSSYPLCRELEADLQQVRNRFGPRWLHSAKLRLAMRAA